MSKPNVKEVLELLEMKRTATAIYDEIDTRIDAFAMEFGAGRFDYDLEEFLDTHPNAIDVYDQEILKDGRYLKLEIINNLAKMKAGENVWKNVNFKPLSFSARSLKRCPESLK